MKTITGKRALALLTAFLLTVTLAACGEKGILGTWEYDEASEYKEPDTKNVVIEIEEDIFRMKRNESGHEMNLDFHYEKDDETLYITDLVQAMADGENVTEKAGFDSGGEMIEIPYKMLDKKLMLDMTETGMGKVIYHRKDK